MTKIKEHIPFGIILSLYVVGFLTLILSSGVLENIDRLFVWCDDAKDYLEYSQYFSRDISTIRSELIAIRPFLFPLFLVLTKMFGVPFFVFLHFVFNVATLIFLYQSSYLLTRSRLFSSLISFVMISSVTFSLITLNALSETSSYCMLSFALLMWVKWYISSQMKWVYYCLFFIAALSLLRPFFLPVFLLCYLYVALKVVDTKKVFKLFAVLIPLLFQLIVSGVLAGKPTLTSSGAHNFFNFVKVTYHHSAYGPYPDELTPDSAQRHYELSKEVLERYPTLKDRLLFLIQNPISVVKTVYFSLFEQNIFTGSEQVYAFAEHSSFRPQTAKVIYDFSKIIGMIYFILELILFIFLFNRKISATTKVMICTLYLILLTSVMAFWHEDRIVSMALPLLTISISLVYRDLKNQLNQSFCHS